MDNKSETIKMNFRLFIGDSIVTHDASTAFEPSARRLLPHVMDKGSWFMNRT